MAGPLGCWRSRSSRQCQSRIASHGGRADLIALDEEKKVGTSNSPRLPGMRDESFDALPGSRPTHRGHPELTGVIDVTDHASVKPFYAKSKKTLRSF